MTAPEGPKDSGEPPGEQGGLSTPTETAPEEVSVGVRGTGADGFRCAIAGIFELSRRVRSGPHGTGQSAAQPDLFQTKLAIVAHVQAIQTVRYCLWIYAVGHGQGIVFAKVERHARQASATRAKLPRQLCVHDGAIIGLGRLVSCKKGCHEVEIRAKIWSFDLLANRDETVTLWCSST